MLVTVAPAKAELLYYDPFNIGSNPANGEYVPFAPPVTAANPFVPLRGQNPTIGPTPFFSGRWVGAPEGDTGQYVQTSSLNYYGVPGSGGSVTSLGDGRVGRYLTNPWTDTTTGTFYISYLASYGTVLDPNTNSGADLGFRTTEFWPAGGAVGIDAGLTEIGYQGFAGPADQQLPRFARLHFQTPGGGGQQYLTETTFNQDNNLTHLILLKFVLSDQPTSDTVSVFLDPVDPTEPLNPSAVAANVDFTLAAMSTISTFGSATGIRPAFDELRVGTEFADMVPPSEPQDGPCDGESVEYACYLHIISHMNLTGQSLANGDVTGDGKVTIADFRFWKDHRTDLSFGSGSLSAVGVPEPASCLLAVAATAVAIASARAPRSLFHR